MLQAAYNWIVLYSTYCTTVDLGPGVFFSCLQNSVRVRTLYLEYSTVQCSSMCLLCQCSCCTGMYYSILYSTDIANAMHHYTNVNSPPVSFLFLFLFATLPRRPCKCPCKRATSAPNPCFLYLPFHEKKTQYLALIQRVKPNRFWVYDEHIRFCHRFW